MQRGITLRHKKMGGQLEETIKDNLVAEGEGQRGEKAIFLYSKGDGGKGVCLKA